MAQELVHYLDKEMVYTGCWQTKDNSIVRLETTDDPNKITCPDCLARGFGFTGSNGAFKDCRDIEREAKGPEEESALTFLEIQETAKAE